MSYGGDPRFLLPTKPLTVAQTESQPVIVKPQDPSGYGYTHGPSGPKPVQVEPKIVQPSSVPTTTDNGSIALGNGLIDLSNQQIIEKNTRIGATNDLITFFNEQVGLRNQDIRQQNQLIEQQNINAKADYAIDTLGSKDNKPFSAKEFFSTELTGLSTGLSKGVGETTNVKLGFGASVPIPATFLSQSAISLGSNLFQGGKQLVAIAPVIGGEYLKLLTTGKSDYSIPKGSTTSVGSGFVESVINPSAGFSKESQAAFASNLAKIDTFIGSIRSTAKTQGLEIPHGQTSYSTAGGAVGTIGAIALSAYGLKDVVGVVPLRVTKIPLPIGEGGSAQIASKALVLGYEGQGSKFLIGKSEKGFYLGTPKPTQLPFEKLTPTETRYGFEVAGNKPVVNKYLTSEPVLQNLVKSGKLSPTGYLDIAEVGREGLPLAAKSPSVIHSKEFPVNTIEGLTPEQTSVLLGNLKATHTEAKGSLVQVPFSKIFNPQTGKFVFRPAKDIDILNVPEKQAIKNNIKRAELLNKVAKPGQTFVAKGTELGIETKLNGITEYRKLIEHPEHTGDELGSPIMNLDFTYGQKIPTGKITYQGIRLNKYNFQIFRKVASSTEYHIGQEGKISVKAASGRETKDPTDVYGAYKTKAYNYMQEGKMKEALRLNEIAEKYRARHKEIDFDKTMVEPGTVTITGATSKIQSASLVTRSSGRFVSSLRNLFSPKSPSNFKSPSGKITSTRFSPKSPSSSTSNTSPKLVSPKSAFSTNSTKSAKLINFPKGSGSPSRSGSPSGKGSPSPSGSPNSPSKGGLSGTFGSPKGRGSPGSPSRTGPTNPVFPPGPPNKRNADLFKFGAVSPKKRGFGRLGPTRTYLHEVNNIFASSLSIKRIK